MRGPTRHAEILRAREALGLLEDAALGKRPHTVIDEMHAIGQVDELLRDLLVISERRRRPRRPAQQPPPPA